VSNFFGWWLFKYIGKVCGDGSHPNNFKSNNDFYINFFFSNENQIHLAKYLSFSISLAGLLQIIWILIHLRNSESSLNFKLPKIKGVKEIMYPGQNKDKRFKMNLKKEIKLSKIIQKDLVDLKN